MRDLINSPEFHQLTGAVFLELASNSQVELDRFFTNSTKDPNIILNIFRNEEIMGWNCRGMHEFMLDLWEVNKQLLPEKKIKVFAVDFPRPFHTPITTKAQYQAFFDDLPDRNVCMATIIEDYIQSSSDKRNCLFIVGNGHAYKSQVLFRARFLQTGRSAGSLLLEKLPATDIFSIFTHSPKIANNGYLYGQLRKGLFDYTFAEIGNKPVAFNLHGSPFGKEPFDASAEICFDINAGNFMDNYDAYIFLQPLNEELNNTPLYELYTDDFIAEIKRRAYFLGYDTENDALWGIFKIKDLTKEQIIEYLKTPVGHVRWEGIDK